MSRNLCQGDTEKCFLILTEEYQTERIFVGTGRKIEEFGFHERHFCREKQQTYKSRSSCSAEAFYVLTLNGIGLDGEAFYTLTLTKIKKSNLW